VWKADNVSGTENNLFEAKYKLMEAYGSYYATI
jgi:hypothetical protein